MDRTIRALTMPPPKPPPEDPFEAIRTTVQSLRFGTVTIVVHDSRIVQMEITEKKRFQG